MWEMGYHFPSEACMLASQWARRKYLVHLLLLLRVGQHRHSYRCRWWTHVHVDCEKLV